MFVPIQIFLDGRDKPPVTYNATLPRGNDADLGEEVDEGAAIDAKVVAKAVTHAAHAGDAEPCFVLGMGIEEAWVGRE